MRVHRSWTWRFWWMLCQVLSLPSQSCTSKVKITETSSVAVAAVIPIKGMIQFSCNDRYWVLASESQHKEGDFINLYTTVGYQKSENTSNLSLLSVRLVNRASHFLAFPWQTWIFYSKTYELFLSSITRLPTDEDRLLSDNIPAPNEGLSFPSVIRMTEVYHCSYSRWQAELEHVFLFLIC